MARVYLGLGSNLGDREANLRRALREMALRGIWVGRMSPLYETEPWGVTDQPRFLNAACVICTDLAPLDLLDALKEIERQMGRIEGIRWGPRVIDLDILFYGDQRVDTPRLQVPHGGVTERASVLTPLADIAPGLCHPVTGRSVAEHLADLGALVGLAPYPPGL